MKPALAAAIAIVALAGATTAAAKQAAVTPSFQPSAEQVLEDQLRAAYSHLQDNDLPAAASAYEQAIESAAFAQLPESRRFAALDVAARIASDRHDTRQQLKFATAATASPLATGMTWYLRLAAAFALQEFVDSALCVETIARRWPQMLGQIRDEALFRIERELGDDPSRHPLQRDYLDALFAANWTPEGIQPSGSWLVLARRLVENGDAARAAVVASRIDAPRAAVELLADKRFAPLGAAATTPDIARLLAAAVARDEGRVEKSPKSLKAVVELQNDLIQGMQFARVITIADAIIARVGGGEHADLYEDFDMYVWVLDSRSRALQCLGRWDEAEQQEIKAARRPEHGNMNVSQAINLGVLLVDVGKPDAAIEAVSEVGPMSGFGRMQLEWVKLSAAVQKDAAADIDAHLAYMKIHRDDAIATYNDALIETNRLDAAAALFVERLISDTWRGAALVAVQHYREIPQTPVLRSRSQRWDTVLARPDVQAALAKVGTVHAVDLSPPKS